LNVKPNSKIKEKKEEEEEEEVKEVPNLKFIPFLFSSGF